MPITQAHHARVQQKSETTYHSAKSFATDFDPSSSTSVRILASPKIHRQMFHVKHTPYSLCWARIPGCAIVAADGPHNSDRESKRWGRQDHHHYQLGRNSCGCGNEGADCRCRSSGKQHQRPWPSWQIPERFLSGADPERAPEFNKPGH